MVRIITINDFTIDYINYDYLTGYIIVTHHPQTSITLAKGSKLQLNVTAEGPGKTNFVYQWKKRGSNSLPNRVSGEDTSKLTISSVISSDSGSYYCVVTNQWGNMTTSNDSTVMVFRKSLH